jgi:DNA adenine methylase
MSSVPIHAPHIAQLHDHLPLVPKKGSSGYVTHWQQRRDRQTQIGATPDIVARPFVKWAGGKRQLLPELLSRVPENFHRYHEPFVGGGALFFALSHLGRLASQRARLADINTDLINAYQVVRDRVETLIVLLSQFHNEESFYYEVRAQDPRNLDPVARAARLLYLNKTCFNGLFRENRQGRFNVPFGHYRDPQFLRENDLRAASRALRGVAIEQAGFEELLTEVKPGDFVYCDPPYAPVSRTAAFVSYSAGGFDRAAQARLADVVRKLADRGASVLLSNSAVPLTRELYQDFHLEEVQAARAINSRGDRRGKVAELLVAAGPLSQKLAARSEVAAALQNAHLRQESA